MGLQERLIGAADRLADAAGLLRRPLRAEPLIAASLRRSRQRGFSDTEFLDPLHRLLSATADEAALSLIGRMATRWDVVRFLTNLLRFQAAEAGDASILDQPIGQPIFITGLPRSGTTFLHRLLLEDPANRAPLVWQTIYPYPPESGADKRVAQVARQLRAFERLAPEFRPLHPLDATSPQECSEITAHVFRSLRFDTTYHIPSYRTWLDQAGHLPAYRFHKRFLQHLQHQAPGRRWVVKCPDHLFALDAIRAVYPDARLVFVHRDPVKVLLSVAKLTEVLRRPFTRRLDPLEIGRQESARWLEGTRQMVAMGDDAGLPEPVHHVDHNALVADPVDAVGALYRHFGLTLSPQTAEAIERYVRQRPRGGYGPRNYRFADHGLNEAAEREKFRGYVERFGLG
ncbi:MAG TPA: sulfotransferase [Acetobacteraceae bacterium]|nr:sulfotransferase [Acetobacteraceae bacterium]